MHYTDAVYSLFFNLTQTYSKYVQYNVLNFVCSRQLSAVKVNMAKFVSASVSIAFLTCFLTKGAKIAHLVCYVYLSYDTGIHDGINCQLIGVGNWTLEHNNTGNEMPQLHRIGHG